jgi:hypothetical protein
MIPLKYGMLKGYCWETLLHKLNFGSKREHIYGELLETLNNMRPPFISKFPKRPNTRK